MKEYELLELTKEQQRAFNRLKKAHKDCLKSGIIFYNNYGALGALDSDKIGGYDDVNDDKAIENTTQNIENELDLSCCEWADDTHYFHPTKR